MGQLYHHSDLGPDRGVSLAPLIAHLLAVGGGGQLPDEQPAEGMQEDCLWVTLSDPEIGSLVRGPGFVTRRGGIEP
jgi:hypothetical protein